MSTESKVEDFGKLKTRISEREAMLSQIISFVGSVVQRHGRVTKIEEESDLTRIDRELKDFNCLDIYWHAGRSNRIDIFFGYPRDQKVKGFSMSYWYEGIDNCTVNLFSDDINWQDAFKYAQKNADKILAAKEETQNQAERMSEMVHRGKEEEARLLKRAKDLGLD